MKKAYKMLLTGLLLPLLLAACRLIPSASPTPGAPTMPPAVIDGGVPPREDPLDIWREQPLFQDAEVIVPERAFNYPVLIVDRLQLNWKVLERFLRANIPDGVFLNEEAEYFADSGYVDKWVYGKSHSEYTLRTDVYETEYCQETAYIYEGILSSSYIFQKWYENLPLIDRFATPDPAVWGELGPARYSEQQAVDLVLSVLHEWGVPVEELELNEIWAYDAITSIEEESTMSGKQRMYREYILRPDPSDDNELKKIDLPLAERGYWMRFGHTPYDIPVYQGVYLQERNPTATEDPTIEPIIENVFVYFWGDSVIAIVNDLGLRSLDLRFHRVVEVEQHDVPILPLWDVVTKHFEMLRELKRIERVELMLVPTYYSEEYEQTRYRLVPAWCFFSAKLGEVPYPHVFIDAIEGKTISPPDDSWQLWPPE